MTLNIKTRKVQIFSPHRLCPQSRLQALYGFISFFLIFLLQSKKGLSLSNKTWNLINIQVHAYVSKSHLPVACENIAASTFSGTPGKDLYEGLQINCCHGDTRISLFSLTLSAVAYFLFIALCRFRLYFILFWPLFFCCHFLSWMACPHVFVILKSSWEKWEVM